MIDQDAPVDRDEKMAEAINLETKYYYNTTTIPSSKNSGKYFERLKMKFGGKKYGNQFTNTEEKKQFMRDMHKIAVDVTFTQIIAKKGLK